MNMRDLVQGSEAWRRARAGSLGASSMHEAIARIKTGWGASRYNLMGRLIAERLSGRPIDMFQSAAMRWGNQMEPEARSAYEFLTGREIELVGIVPHPKIIGSHASPDCFVNEDGLLEIKCPETHTHIDTLLTGYFNACYATQAQWQMACTGRNWVDLVSFDPRLPEEMQLHIKTIHRDPKRISELETLAAEFIAEMEAKIAALCLKAGVPVPERYTADMIVAEIEEEEDADALALGF